MVSMKHAKATVTVVSARGHEVAKDVEGDRASIMRFARDVAREARRFGQKTMVHFSTELHPVRIAV
jgi:hypothetical protein